MNLNKPLAQHFVADTLVDLITPTMLSIRTNEMNEGETLSAQARADLLKQVRAGEFAGPLIVDAVTFIQRATPNRNFTRFAKGTLRSGAKSFAGMVILLDHAQRSQQSRIGTILKSRAEKVGDEVHFVQTLSFVKMHAIESVLDGTIDRFSIGWFPTGKVECSVHKQPLWGAGACPCWPGDSVDGKLVEAVFTAWEGIEVSAVNVPAVVGTGIEQIRAALTAMRADNSGEKPRNKDNLDMNIRSILGLPDTATDEEVQAELTKREDERKTLSTKVAQHEANAATSEAQLAAARAARLNGTISAAYADGRLSIVRDSAGKQIASELETRIRSVASVDVESAIALVDALPKSHPNGNPAQLQSQRAAAKVDDVAQRNVNPALDGMLPLMGLDAKDVEEYGPQHRKASPKNAPVPRHLSKLFATRFINHQPAGK